MATILTFFEAIVVDLSFTFRPFQTEILELIHTPLPAQFRQWTVNSTIQIYNGFFMPLSKEATNVEKCRKKLDKN